MVFYLGNQCITIDDVLISYIEKQIINIRLDPTGSKLS